MQRPLSLLPVIPFLSVYVSSQPTLENACGNNFRRPPITNTPARRSTRDEPDSVPARQPAETRDTDIEYKGHDTGIEVQLVNKYDTSQTCNRCAREGVRATQEGV